jgi:hypothetical protein
MVSPSVPRAFQAERGTRLLGRFLPGGWASQRVERPQMDQNASHPCNFAMQGFDTPLLALMRNIRRHAAKRARTRWT